jgi:hypothetical protein
MLTAIPIGHMRKRLIGLLFLGLLSCDSSNTFQIEFEQVDRLASGDIVILNKEKVGIVKDVKLNSDRKVIATIQLDKPLNIPDNSNFILTYDFLGTPQILIESADNEKTIDFKTIQKGQTRKIQFDSTNIELTKEKYDSLLKFDSAFRVNDSIVKTIFPLKEDKKKEPEK